MTLWSLLKTYFQMKRVGSAWAWASAAWAVSAWAIRTSLSFGCRDKASYSAVASWRVFSRSAAGTTWTMSPHAVVAEAAVLGAGDLVVARLLGHEPGLEVMPGIASCFTRKFGQEEAVDHVQRAQPHPHRPALGQEELVLAA